MNQTRNNGMERKKQQPTNKIQSARKLPFISRWMDTEFWGVWMIHYIKPVCMCCLYINGITFMYVMLCDCLCACVRFDIKLDFSVGIFKEYALLNATHSYRLSVWIAFNKKLSHVCYVCMDGCTSTWGPDGVSKSEWTIKKTPRIAPQCDLKISEIKIPRDFR